MHVRVTLDLAFYLILISIFHFYKFEINRMAQTFKSNFVVDAQRLYRNAFCESSFSTWDFAVTGKKLMMNKYNANSSQLKVNCMYYLLLEQQSF